MLQYYLRAEGLALSWVGTGRLIFSLNYTRRRLRRGRASASSPPRGRCRPTAGGGATPALTNKAIRRGILREMLRAPVAGSISALSAALHVRHRVDQLAAQQVQRRLVVELDVVERVGEDLGHPHQAGLHVLQEEQVHGAEQQAADAERQPDHADVAARSRRQSLRRLDQPEQRRIEPAAAAATAPRAPSARPCGAGCSRP